MLILINGSASVSFKMDGAAVVWEDECGPGPQSSAPGTVC